MGEPFIEDHLHAVKEERQKEINTLRQASTWEDFKKRCGRIDGLEKAVSIYEEVRKKYLSEDEDDDDDD